jgi:S-DNA-T family DNA segregation ATPase FtsK/SpoIIIE
MRCAFRTVNANNSDVILGEGWAKAGFNAADIALESRGVGLLLAEGSKPQKFKGAWISDDAIADLSLTTIPLKPRYVPVPDVADVAA